MRINAILTKSYRNETIYAKHPCFQKRVGGVEYSDDVVKAAETFIKTGKKLDPKNYQASFMDCWENSKFAPIEWAAMPFTYLIGKAEGEDSEDIPHITRMSFGIATLGLTELLKTPEAGIRKLISNHKSKKFVQQVYECAQALVKEKGHI